MKKSGKSVRVAIALLLTLVCGFSMAACSDTCTHKNETATVITQVTCTQDGRVKYTCDNCGAEREEVVKATGHSYNADGVCTKCGTINAHDTVFWSNVAEGLCFDKFTFSVQDVVITVNQRKTDFEGKVTETLRYTITQLEIAELTAEISETGEICGSGYGKVRVAEETGYNNTQDVKTYTCTFALQDGHVYIDMQGLNKCYVIPFDRFLHRSIPLTYKDLQSFITLWSKDILPAVNKIEQANLPWVNVALGNIFGTVFSNTATDTGFSLQLDYDGVLRVNEDLLTLTVSELVDKYVQEGLLDSVAALVSQTMEQTVLETILQLGAYGIDKNEAYAAANAIMGLWTEDGQFDTDAFLNEEVFVEGKTLYNTTVKEVVCRAAAHCGWNIDAEDGEQVEEFVQFVLDKIDSGISQAKSMTAYELADKYCLFTVNGAMVSEYVTECVEILRDTCDVTVTVDNAGNVLGTVITYDNMAMAVSRWEDNYGSTKETVVNMQGAATLTPQTEVDIDYGVVSAVKNRLPKLENDFTIETETSHWGTYVAVVDDEGFISSLIHKWNSKTSYCLESGVTYDGQICNVYRVDESMGEVVYDLSDRNIESYYVYCGDWNKIEFYGHSQGSSTGKTYIQYVLASDDVTEVARVNEQESTRVYGGSYEWIRAFYYNTKTGEWTVDYPHEWERDEAQCVEPQKCGDTQVTVRVCKNCGEEDRWYDTWEHIDTVVTGELITPNTSCTEGVLRIVYCNACKKVVGKRTVYEHISCTFEYIDLAECGSKCGGVYRVTGCACGEYATYEVIYCYCDRGYIDWGTEIEGIYHNFSIYTCRKQDCGFTYVVERYTTIEQGTDRQIYHVKYYFGVAFTGEGTQQEMFEAGEYTVQQTTEFTR